MDAARGPQMAGKQAAREKEGEYIDDHLGHTLVDLMQPARSKADQAKEVAAVRDDAMHDERDRAHGMVAILNLARASEGDAQMAEKLGKVSPTAVNVLSAWGGGGGAAAKPAAAAPAPRRRPPAAKDLALNVPGQSPRVVRGTKLTKTAPQRSSVVRPLASSNGTSDVALLRGTAVQLPGGGTKKKKRRKKKKKRTDQQMDGVHHSRQHGGGKILPMKVSAALVVTNNSDQKASALNRWRKARIQTKVIKVVGNMLTARQMR